MALRTGTTVYARSDKDGRYYAGKRAVFLPVSAFCSSVLAGVVIGSIEGVSVNVKFQATGRVAALPWADVRLTEPKLDGSATVPMSLDNSLSFAASPPASSAPKAAPRPGSPHAQPPPLQHQKTWSGSRPTAATVSATTASASVSPPTRTGAVMPPLARGNTTAFGGGGSRPPPPEMQPPVSPRSQQTAPSSPPTGAASSAPVAEKRRGITLMGGMRSPRGGAGNAEAAPVVSPRRDAVEIGTPMMPTVRPDGSALERKLSAPTPITRNLCPQCFAAFGSKEALVMHLDRDCKKMVGSAPNVAPISIPSTNQQPSQQSSQQPPVAIARKPTITLGQRPQPVPAVAVSAVALPVQSDKRSPKPAKPSVQEKRVERFDPEIPLRGWINMKSPKGLVKSWKLFYFDQEGSLLHYAKSESDPSAGWIDLYDLRAVEASGSSGISVAVHAGQVFLLRMQNDDADKFQYWLDGFAHYLQVSKAEAASNGLTTSVGSAFEDDDGMTFLDMLSQESNHSSHTTMQQSEEVESPRKFLTTNRSPRGGTSPTSPRSPKSERSPPPSRQPVTSVWPVNKSPTSAPVHVAVAARPVSDMADDSVNVESFGNSMSASVDNSPPVTVTEYEFDLSKSSSDLLDRQTIRLTDSRPSSMDHSAGSGGRPIARVAANASRPNSNSSQKPSLSSSPPPRKLLPMPSQSDLDKEFPNAPVQTEAHVDEPQEPEPVEADLAGPDSEDDYGDTMMLAKIDLPPAVASKRLPVLDEVELPDEDLLKEEMPDEELPAEAEPEDEDDDEEGSSSWEAPSEEWANDEQYLDQPVAEPVAEKPKANKWGGVNVMGFAPSSAVKLKAVSRESRRSKRLTKVAGGPQGKADLPKEFDPKALLGALKKKPMVDVAAEKSRAEEAERAADEERRKRLEAIAEEERRTDEEKKRQVEELAMQLLQEEEKVRALEEQENAEKEVRMREEEAEQERVRLEQEAEAAEQERLRLEEEQAEAERERVRLHEEEDERERLQLQEEEEQRRQLAKDQRLQEELQRAEEEERVRAEAARIAAVSVVAKAEIECPVCGSLNPSSASYCCECGSSDGFHKEAPAVVEPPARVEMPARVEVENKTATAERLDEKADEFSIADVTFDDEEVEQVPATRKMAPVAALPPWKKLPPPAAAPKKVLPAFKVADAKTATVVAVKAASPPEEALFSDLDTEEGDENVGEAAAASEEEEDDDDDALVAERFLEQKQRAQKQHTVEKSLSPPLSAAVPVDAPPSSTVEIEIEELEKELLLLRAKLEQELESVSNLEKESAKQLATMVPRLGELAVEREKLKQRSQTESEERKARLKKEEAQARSDNEKQVAAKRQKMESSRPSVAQAKRVENLREMCSSLQLRKKLADAVKGLQDWEAEMDAQRQLRIEARDAKTSDLETKARLAAEERSEQKTARIEELEAKLAEQQRLKGEQDSALSSLIDVDVEGAKEALRAAREAVDEAREAEATREEQRKKVERGVRENYARKVSALDEAEEARAADLAKIESGQDSGDDEEAEKGKEEEEDAEAEEDGGNKDGEKEAEQFKKGDKVIAKRRAQDEDWLPAKIEYATSDGKYLVSFDHNKSRMLCPGNLVRSTSKRPAKAPKPKVAPKGNKLPVKKARNSQRETMAIQRRSMLEQTEKRIKQDCAAAVQERDQTLTRLQEEREEAAEAIRRLSDDADEAEEAYVQALKAEKEQASLKKKTKGKGAATQRRKQLKALQQELADLDVHFDELEEEANGVLKKAIAAVEDAWEAEEGRINGEMEEVEAGKRQAVEELTSELGDASEVSSVEDANAKLSELGVEEKKLKRMVDEEQAAIEKLTADSSLALKQDLEKLATKAKKEEAAGKAALEKSLADNESEELKLTRLVNEAKAKQKATKDKPEIARMEKEIEAVEAALESLQQQKRQEVEEFEKREAARKKQEEEKKRRDEEARREKEEQKRQEEERKRLELERRQKEEERQKQLEEERKAEAERLEKERLQKLAEEETRRREAERLALEKLEEERMEAERLERELEEERQRQMEEEEHIRREQEQQERERQEQERAEQEMREKEAEDEARRLREEAEEQERLEEECEREREAVLAAQEAERLASEKEEQMARDAQTSLLMEQSELSLIESSTALASGAAVDEGADVLGVHSVGPAAGEDGLEEVAVEELELAGEEEEGRELALGGGDVANEEGAEEDWGGEEEDQAAAPEPAATEPAAPVDPEQYLRDLESDERELVVAFEAEQAEALAAWEDERYVRLSQLEQLMKKIKQGIKAVSARAAIMVAQNSSAETEFEVEVQQICASVDEIVASCTDDVEVAQLISALQGAREASRVFNGRVAQAGAAGKPLLKGEVSVYVASLKLLAAAVSAAASHRTLAIESEVHQPIVDADVMKAITDLRQMIAVVKKGMQKPAGRRTIKSTAPKKALPRASMFGARK